VQMDHGVPNTTVFRAWAIGVPVAYFFFIGLFRLLNVLPEKTRDGSRGSDMLAFLIVAGSCCAYLGVLGTIGWFGFVPSDANNLTPDNFYAKSQFVEDHLIAPMLAYQGWNLLLCFVVKDLRDPNMIGHHFATGMLGYFGLHPYLHYYGLFFFGFAEMTNIPLTFVDVFKYLPKWKESLSWLNELSRTIFAISFIIIRLFLWPYYSYTFWKGSLDLLQSGTAHSTFVVSFFLLANMFLTGLQFFWGYKIFGFLLPKKQKQKNT
jgi:hypothetical protein